MTLPHAHRAGAIALALAAFLLFGGCENPAGSDDPAGGPPAGPDIPASPVSFANTVKDSSGASFDLSAWAGYGTGEETWRIGAVEEGRVYFAVNKSPAQTISAGGQAASRLTMAAEGQTVDGSTAAGNLAVFTVDTRDLVCDGGTVSFTLTVTGDDTPDVVVAVDLEIAPDLNQGVAVFVPNSDGGLTRLRSDTAANYANGSYNLGGDFKEPNNLPFAELNSLFTALKWIDRYAQSGTSNAWKEYLIRVEKDEEIPMMSLNFQIGNNEPHGDYVKIRLRGCGGERVIRHKAKATGYKLYSGSMGSGLISLGRSGSENSHVALSIENNITIDAGDDPAFPGSGTNDPESIIWINRYASFFMEPGSVLRRYDSSGSSADFFKCVVYTNGVFDMSGGTIRDNKVSGGSNYGIINLANTEAAFIYRAGEFSGNSNNNVGRSGSGAARPYTEFSVP